MSPDMRIAEHRRAEELIETALAVGRGELPGADRAWLDAHLEQCSSCAAQAAAVRNLVQALKAVPVQFSPSLVRTTQLQVRRRAHELGERRANMAMLWIACGLSWAWMLLTTPYLWRAFAWAGQRTSVPDMVWQGTFFLVWFMPASVLAVVLMVRRPNGWQAAGDAEESRVL